jgi:hypothetical protein
MKGQALDDDIVPAVSSTLSTVSKASVRKAMIRVYLISDPASHGATSSSSDPRAWIVKVFEVATRF